MPRREEPVDPRSPIADFAIGLRGLKADTTYRALAVAAKYSTPVLWGAASGKSLPTWDVTRCFVAACGATPEQQQQWRTRWEHARAAWKKAQARDHEQTGHHGARRAAHPAGSETPPVQADPVRPATATAAEVIVSFRRRLWRLRRGDGLTIGRGPANNVALPDDPTLSRSMAKLRFVDDLVFIQNVSRRALAVRPPAGPDQVVSPGGAVATAPHREVDLIVMHEATGSELVIHIDASRLPEVRLDTPDQIIRDGISLTGTQHRVLVALCAPMLTRRGLAARPATYAEIGRKLDRQPLYVRNVLKALREHLTGHGILGLISEDQHEAPATDFRPFLAGWAISNGVVTIEDVAHSDAHVASSHVS